LFLIFLRPQNKLPDSLRQLIFLFNLYIRYGDLIACDCGIHGSVRARKYCRMSDLYSCIFGFDCKWAFFTKNDSFGLFLHPLPFEIQLLPFEIQQIY